MELIIVVVIIVGFFIYNQFEKEKRAKKEKEQREHARRGIIEYEASELKRQIDTSMELVNNSKHLNTRLGRIKDSIEFLTRFKEYEHHPFITIDPPTGEFINTLRHLNDELIQDEIEQLIAKAKIKIEHAKTLSAKTNPLTRILEKIEDFKESLHNPDSLSNHIQKCKEMIQFIELNESLEKAKREEFKENNKKALSLYMDALFFLQADTTYQQLKDNHLDEVEAKIIELKGEDAQVK